MINNIASQASSGTWAEAVIKDMRALRGGMAIFWAVVFGVLLLIFGPQEWVHDLKPTRDFFDAHPVFGGALVAMYGTFAAQALLIALPILLNAVAARYTTTLKGAALIVLLVEGADAYTDWVPAGEVFSGYWPMPVLSENPLGFLWWGLWRLLWQAWCTDGLELVCAACLVGFAVCAFNSFRKPSATR